MEKMYMYIGNDYVIESKQIIAILNVQQVDSYLIFKKVVNDAQILGSKKGAKSIIITNNCIYYSPFSTLTLKNRDELYGKFKKENELNMN